MNPKTVITSLNAVAEHLDAAGHVEDASLLDAVASRFAQAVLATRTASGPRYSPHGNPSDLDIGYFTNEELRRAGRSLNNADGHLSPDQQWAEDHMNAIQREYDRRGLHEEGLPEVEMAADRVPNPAGRDRTPARRLTDSEKADKYWANHDPDADYEAADYEDEEGLHEEGTPEHGVPQLAGHDWTAALASTDAAVAPREEFGGTPHVFASNLINYKRA